MKFLLFVLFLFVSSCCMAQEQYPINFNADSLKMAKNYPWLWENKIVAVQGIITEVRKAYKRQYYFINIGNDVTIGVGSLANSDGKRNRKGDSVKVLGYFKTISNADRVRAFNTDTHHIIGFGLVNISTQKIQLYQGNEQQVNEWAAGSIPIAER